MFGFIIVSFILLCGLGNLIDKFSPHIKSFIFDFKYKKAYFKKYGKYY